MRRLLYLSAAVMACFCLAYLTADAQTTRTANLSWGAVTKDVEGNTITGVTYKVYQGAKGSTTKTVIRTGLNVLSQAIAGLPPGETCWQVSANTTAGGESALSNEGCKSFPIPAPEAPVLTVN